MEVAVSRGRGYGDADAVSVALRGGEFLEALPDGEQVLFKFVEFTPPPFDVG